MPKYIYLYPYEPATFIADGFPGHCIIANRCQLRLHHHVMSESGMRYRVSTIGLMPDRFGVDSIEYTSNKWLQFGWDGDIFETMVFKERPDSNRHMEIMHPNIEIMRSLTSIEATEKHWKLVHKYLRR